MKRAITLLLCLVMLSCLFGCAKEALKKKAAEPETQVEEGPYTKYNLVSILMDNITMTGEEARESSGIDDLYIKFYEDGTAKLRLEKDILHMCYDDQYLWPTERPQEKVSYTISGTSVSVYDGAYVFNFVLAQ